MRPVSRFRIILTNLTNGLHAIAMVELKGKDGEPPNLMEIDKRLWGSLQLAVDCRIDFPWMLYQISNGKTVNTTDDYKVGGRLRWLPGDVDSLYLTLRDSRYSYRDKISALLKFILPATLKKPGVRLIAG